MVFILGVENMPYCCAAKSIRNEVGACEMKCEPSIGRDDP